MSGQYYQPTLKLGVLKELKRLGISSEAVEIIEDYGTAIIPYLRVEMKGTEYFFKVKHLKDKGLMFGVLSPGRLLKEETNEYTSSFFAEYAVHQMLRTWIGNINQGAKDAEEYLKMLQEKTVNFTFEDEFFSEEYFNEEEKKDVKERIKLLQAKIKTLNLIPAQIEEINKKLDHLTSNQMLSLRKIDWRNQLVGVVFGIIINLTLDRSIGESLFNVVSSAFTGVKHYFLTP